MKVNRTLALLALFALCPLLPADAQRSTFSAPRTTYSAPKVYTAPSVPRAGVYTPKTPTSRAPTTGLFPRRSTTNVPPAASAQRLTPFPPVSRTAPVTSYRSYNAYESPNGFANVLPWLFLWSATNDVDVELAEAGEVERVADRTVGVNPVAVVGILASLGVLVAVIFFYRLVRS